MQRWQSPILLALSLGLAAPLGAQLALPQVPVVSGIGDRLTSALGQVGDVARGTLARTSETLRLARLDRIAALLRQNRTTMERDIDGQPARRGTLLALDLQDGDAARLAALGFAAGGATRLDDLDMAVTELSVPTGMDLAEAQRLLARELPALSVSSDALHFQSGGANSTGASAPAGLRRGPIAVPVGLIDGAPAQPVAGLRGFAVGAPTASNHGSAVASLAAGAGVQRLFVADVYGRDPAGGNALAIVRGMNWLVGQGVRVVSISLVGPRSPVLQRAVDGARAKGVVVVAAVGNDGPAAPPSFPASYAGVLAVTAVDKRNRPLIEAGRALHLDYAAPGADIAALNAAGRRMAVRGTSYATPLVAARAAAALQAGADARSLVPALDNEARLLGKQRPDPRSGRGLLCEWCR
ncbi:subtilase family protein [Novosphingobium kunmingense]|uniref:Subtilase family protein n=1 Tax=Novosphingobium kunmingense TaxID=1211806 RepID=A0A2N0I2T5_9SPHN|nr:S8 family serine peptidase [Novosphingobium kunmingense]PKB25506.1 subtilase family protein [Novosphingobium kunmingense]